MAPEEIPVETVLSPVVATVMPLLTPTVAAPIVMPLRVMVKGVSAAMPAVPGVITIWVDDMVQAPVMVATDASPAANVGVGVVAKNPEG